jgi:site-specific DNA recombinase
LTKRMENARNLMLDNDIEAVDYRAIKEECNEKIARLEARLSDLNVENSTVIDIKPIANEAIKSLRLLDEFYEKATVEGKRYLVWRLFPEKVTYDGAMYRTPYKNSLCPIKGGIWGSNPKQKSLNFFKLRLFSGPDGTRTRDLRRDRAAF